LGYRYAAITTGIESNGDRIIGVCPMKATRFARKTTMDEMIIAVFQAPSLPRQKATDLIRIPPSIQP
jgi:hypothetical protein